MNNNPSQAFRNLIPTLSPYVYVGVLQFLLLYPLHTTMDFPKYTHESYAACAPMMDKTRFVAWL
jgi:hypothetical protein